MKCHLCAGETTVVETRKLEKNVMKRRRACQSCGNRFTTLEKRLADSSTGAKSKPTL